MIFYKAVKYKIIDICLEVLFGKLYQNVNPLRKIYSNDLYVGMILSKIKYKKVVFLNCEITKAKPFSMIGHMVAFNFTYSEIVNKELIGDLRGLVYINENDKTCSTLSVLDNRFENHVYEFIP